MTICSLGRTHRPPRLSTTMEMTRGDGERTRMPKGSEKGSDLVCLSVDPLDSYQYKPGRGNPLKMKAYDSRNHRRRKTVEKAPPLKHTLGTGGCAGKALDIVNFGGDGFVDSTCFSSKVLHLGGSTTWTLCGILKISKIVRTVANICMK